MKTLKDSIRTREFTLIGQLRLDQDDGREDVLRQAASLAPVVDAVAVTDCPYGVLHMKPCSDFGSSRVESSRTGTASP